MTHKPQPVSEATPLDLDAIVAELREDAAYSNSGHTARTLVRASDIRIVLVAIKSGGGMHEHETRETAVLHVLTGHVHLDLPSGPVNLAAGQMMPLEKGLKHTVEAYSDSAFLLTLGWPAEVDDE